MSIHIRTPWSFVRSFVMYSMVLMGAASPGWAGPIEIRRVDTEEFFSLTAFHGPLAEDGFHNLLGGDNWSTGNWIAEGGDPHPDNLIVRGSYSHIKPPPDHGEGPNFSGMSHTWSIVAFAEPGDIVTRTHYLPVDHGDHKDIYTAYVSARIAHSPGKHDIESYVYAVTGRHTESTQNKVLGASLTGGEEPGGIATNAHGVTTTVVDLQSGTFDLDIFVYDIDWNQLTGAHIHLGSPGTHGPPIYDLNPSLFEDVGGQGVVRSIQNGHLPMQYLPALLAGHAYIDLHTHQHPNGEIRGQLLPMTASLPGDLNNDGEVNAADYVFWRKNNGTPEEYQLWRSNFGHTGANGHLSAPPTNSNTSVPEPASLLLLLVGGMMAASRRDKRGNFAFRR